MAAKKLFTQIFIYFSKPLRLLYSLIIYEIVNFSFFTLYSLLLLSFFLYLKSVPIYVIVHVCIHKFYVHMYTYNSVVIMYLLFTCCLCTSRGAIYVELSRFFTVTYMACCKLACSIYTKQG